MKKVFTIAYVIIVLGTILYLANVLEEINMINLWWNIFLAAGCTPEALVLGWEFVMIFAFVTLVLYGGYQLLSSSLPKKEKS